MRPHATTLALAAAAAVACAPVAPATPTTTPAAPMSADSTTSTFVVLAGADTIAVERFTRTPSRLSGELTTRAQGITQSWSIELSPTGAATSVMAHVRRMGAAPTDPPLQSASITFTGDSATTVAGGATRSIPAPRGTLPYINLSAGVVEQIVRQARAAGGDTVTVPILPIGAPQTVPAQLRLTSADSAVLTVGGIALHVATDDGGALRGATVPAQGVRFVRAEGDVSLAAAPPPDYSAPPSAPYAAHDVTLRSDATGVTMAGTLTLPRGASATSRVPAVVLISGSGPQDRNGSSPALPGWAPFRELADTLSRRGIAVLRLDDRGVGGTEAGPPTTTSADLASDVRAALAFLRARPEIDPARLALLGHSEGGIIAPMVARTDGALGAVVLVAAQSRPGRQVVDSQYVQSLRERRLPAAQHDSLLRVNQHALDSLAAGSPWLTYFLGYDPLPAARELRAPVLIVQGATDLQVTADQAEELAAAIRAGGNRDVTVRVFPDVNHLLVRDPSGAFSGYTSLPSMALVPEVLGTIADWLGVKLGSE